MSLTSRLVRAALYAFALLATLALLFGCSSIQRKLLYFPSHDADSNGLAEWKYQGQLIGFSREVPAPKNVWLLIHGNGGQATHMAYALPRFSSKDSIFILEYPGYGLRIGTPSMRSINQAAQQAYELLRNRFPQNPVCVIGESLGTGPTSFLTTNFRPPDKVILIVPYDELAKVAAEHYPFLPVRLLLHDNWNNVMALASYHGPLEIYAAERDTVIPISHAKALAATKPQAVFHEMPGGHSDWSRNPNIQFRGP